MNTVLYIRVSTQEQAEEGFSLEAQKDRLINFCKAKDWSVTNVYVDPGFSGSSLNRPAIQQLIDHAKDKRFDMVLVYKLDRLSRSQKDTLYLIEDVFIKHGIDFVSMQESFDTSTAFGRAMIGILSVFAQLERENFKERSKMGKSERAKQGLWKGGNLPTGYDYIGGTLVPNEKAATVRKIYNMYIDGIGVPTISKETGYKQGASVYCILRSPIYAGKVSHKGNLYDGNHEAIIPYDTFLHVQKLIKTRSCKRGKEAKGPFAGMMFCKRCGAKFFRYKGNNRDNYYYYGCYSRHYRASAIHSHMVKDPACRNDIWKSELFEAAVMTEIKRTVCDEKRLEALLIPEPDNNKRDVERAKRDIKTLDQKISKLMDLYLDDSMPAEVVKAKIDALTANKAALTDMVEAESHKSRPDEKAWLHEQYRNVATLLDTMDIPEQRNLLSTTIKRIVIDGGSFEIEWYV